MKITHEKNKCIGCGVCASVCPKYFEMTEKGKAHLKGSELINEENDEYSLEVDENGCAKEASDGCPVQCIHLKD